MAAKRPWLQVLSKRRRYFCARPRLQEQAPPKPPVRREISSLGDGWNPFPPARRAMLALTSDKEPVNSTRRTIYKSKNGTNERRNSESVYGGATTPLSQPSFRISVESAARRNWKEMT